jgi:hypothetical protein
VNAVIRPVITTIASTKPGSNKISNDRAALNSTNTHNKETSLLWWCQTTIRIQIFSNLAKEQSPLEEVTFSDGLFFLQGCFFLAGGSKQVR